MKYSLAVAALLGTTGAWEAMLKEGCTKKLELLERKLWESAEADAKKNPRDAEIDKMTMELDKEFAADCKFSAKRETKPDGTVYEQEYLACEDAKVRDLLGQEKKLEEDFKKIPDTEVAKEFWEFTSTLKDCLEKKPGDDAKPDLSEVPLLAGCSAKIEEMEKKFYETAEMDAKKHPDAAKMDEMAMYLDKEFAGDCKFYTKEVGDKKQDYMACAADKVKALMEDTGKFEDMLEKAGEKSAVATEFWELKKMVGECMEKKPKPDDKKVKEWALESGCTEKIEMMEKKLWETAEMDMKKEPKDAEVDKLTMELEKEFEGSCKFFAKKFDKDGKWYEQEFMECPEDKLKPLLETEGKLEELMKKMGDEKSLVAEEFWELKKTLGECMEKKPKDDLIELTTLPELMQ